MQTPIANQMQKLLDCLHQNRQPEGGLAFPAVWQPLKLDYTPDSIQRINRLLKQIRTNSEYTSRSIKQKPSGKNFIDTLAAYLAQYLAHHSGVATEWHEDGSISTGTTTYPIVQAICQAMDRPDCEINLDNPLWQILCFNIEAHKNTLRNLILGNFLNKQSLPEGLANSSALTSIAFDFSETSLQQIDKLVQLLSKHNRLYPDNIRAWATQSPSYRNLFLLLGFYIGETVAKQLGQTIMWNNAHRLAEVTKQPISPDFFDSIVADFGNGIVTPVLNIVEQMFTNPNVSSMGWLDYLRHEETHSAEQTPDNTDMNQIARRAVDGFIRQQSPDGSPMPQVAYDNELREIGLDYHIESIKKLDKLLHIIRTAQPEFTRFAAAAPTQNFLHLCAFYLARTAAHLSNNSLKFLNYQETKTLQPNLPNEFFHRYSALIGGKLFFPLQQITAQIWQYPEPQNSYNLITEIIRDYRGGLVQQPPLTNFVAEPMPLEWKLALKAAGFGAAWALWEKRQKTELITPTLVQPNGTGINLLKLNTNSITEAMQSGHDMLKKNPERLPHQAFLYESFANLPQGRFDAIAVEMCVYQGNKPLYIFGLLPFMYAGDEVKFVNGNLAINSDSLNNPKLAHSIIQLLYQGMDDFFTPQKNTPRLWWRKSWRDVL